MKEIFIVALILTFLIVRIGAHNLHDRKNYRTEKDKSKTPTKWLRTKTGYDLHHFHIGILIIILTLTTIFLTHLTTISAIVLAIGTSMFLDQIIPWLGIKIDYFSKESIFLALLLHLILIAFVILI